MMMEEGSKKRGSSNIAKGKSERRRKSHLTPHKGRSKEKMSQMELKGVIGAKTCAILNQILKSGILMYFIRWILVHRFLINNGVRGICMCYTNYWVLVVREVWQDSIHFREKVIHCVTAFFLLFNHIFYKTCIIMKKAWISHEKIDVTSASSCVGKRARYWNENVVIQIVNGWSFPIGPWRGWWLGWRVEWWGWWWKGIAAARAAVLFAQFPVDFELLKGGLVPIVMPGDLVPIEIAVAPCLVVA